MPGRMTRDDLVTVLLNRYPTREELERLPLGRHHLELDARVWTKASRPIDLAEPDALLTRSDDLGEQEENRKQILEKLEADGLIAKTEKLGEVYRHHMLSLMKGVRAIVTGDLGSICEAGFDPYETRPSKELDVLPLTCAPFANLGRSHAHAAERLLLTALYHDVGKAVHRDAHGRLGWHMLQGEGLSKETKDYLQDLFGGEGELRLVAEFLRYHDLFGSVSTGESNLAALIEPATFPAPSEEEQNEVLSSLLMLNVADAYAAVGKPLWRDKLRVLLKAWLDMVYWVAPKAANLDPVIERPRTRRQLERAVLGECDDTRAAAERLRQTLESSFQTKLPEIAREAMVDRLSTQQLYTAMQTILGAEMAFFPHDLALVCKFDYMLRVVETLTEQWFRSALVQAHRAITEEDGVVDNEGAGPAFRWPRVLEQSAFESAYGASAPSIAGLPRTWTDWEIDEQGAFVDAIAKESLQVELASLPTDQRSRLLERVDIVPLAKAFVAFVYELVRCNRDLCRAREGLERRIVVELLSLSRDDRLRERVSWLMLTTPKEGVVWAADETSAFYFS